MIAILIVFAGVVIGLLLLRRMWMENVDYMNKTGLQPLPGESLKAFRERVRREFPTSSKIPVNDSVHRTVDGRNHWSGNKTQRLMKPGSESIAPSIEYLGASHPSSG